MLTALFMALEAIALGAAALVFLTVIGLGLVELLVPADGFELLLAPAVGLAVLALGIQWLSFLMPPVVATLVVFAALGALTSVVVWPRRKKLRARWPDLAGAGAVALVFFVALIQIDLQRGFFTLGGFPSDNVFIYVQAAQYLVDHAMPFPHAALTLSSPGSVYLVTTGAAFPNSVGPIDAAASVLSGWPVYQVFDLVNGLALAIIVGPVWFLVRFGLGGSWLTAAAAGALLASSQLLYWVIGNGFQQECLALPIFTAGLGATICAVRSGRVHAGALTGVLAASLIGIYLPIAVLLVLCALAYASVHVIVDRETSWKAVLRPLAGAAAAGAIAGLAAIYVLLVQDGLSSWLTATSIRVPAGGISRFPYLPYLLGTVPFAHVWEPLPQPYGRLEKLAYPALLLASALLVILLIVGQARAAVQKHAPEAAVLGAGILFIGYEAAVARYPYGYVKAIGYMVPLTSAFIAFGAIGLESLVRPRLRQAARAAGMAAIVLVLLASVLASRDMVRLWVENPGNPSFTRSYIALAGLTAAVPVGKSVFIDYPAADYAALVKVAAVAYFLPDRSVRIFTGDLRVGTFLLQNVMPDPCGFDYVISTTAPAASFALVSSDPSAGLRVYKRLGAACSGG
jgi:hypothetical protein